MTAKTVDGAADAAPLTPAELEQLRAKLAALGARARSALSRMQGELKGEDADLFRDLGPTGDWAIAEAEFERDMASAAQFRTVVDQLASAERRLQSGDYGCCEDCGATIGFARLSASPAASRCVACQGAREQAGRGAATR
jgi:RNA polymerase-binding transcription factor DksA